MVSNRWIRQNFGDARRRTTGICFIVSIAYLINADIRVQEVLQSIHPHPSVTEGIQECLRVFYDQSIFKPQAFPNLIRVTEWKP